jgi:hypothetical protein
VKTVAAVALSVTVFLSTTVGAQASPALLSAAPLGVERTVPVASRALPRGATISPADYQIIANRRPPGPPAGSSG